MLDDERRLALHQRQVAPAERRLRLRRLQELSGLRRQVSLVVGVVESEDQLRERLQPAVAHRVGDDLQEFRVTETSVNALEVPPLHAQESFVEREQRRAERVRLSVDAGL